MNRLHIFTPCWGAKHICLLDDALGQSLRAPINAAAVQGAKWTFVTDGENSSEISVIAKSIIPDAEIEILERPPLTNSKDHGEILMAAMMKHVIPECINNQTQMLIACPDFIWGEGSIHTLRVLGKQDGICVSVPHIRVLPSIVSEIKVKFPDHVHYIQKSNHQLMRLAWLHPHKSWTSSNIDLDNTGCFKGGISWRQVTPNVVAVTHVMPSPFLCNFIPSDLIFFCAPPNNAFGSIDHKWPTKLIEEQRLRLVGSSDAVCMVEVTDADANVPPCAVCVDIDPSAFFVDEPHVRIQRQFVSVFRGDV